MNIHYHDNYSKDEKSKKDLALKEIRNGRLAMWAAAGISIYSITSTNYNKLIIIILRYVTTRNCYTPRYP